MYRDRKKRPYSILVEVRVTKKFFVVSVVKKIKHPSDAGVKSIGGISPAGLFYPVVF